MHLMLKLSPFSFRNSWLIGGEMHVLKRRCYMFNVFPVAIKTPPSWRLLKALPWIFLYDVDRNLLALL